MFFARNYSEFFKFTVDVSHVKINKVIAGHTERVMEPPVWYACTGSSIVLSLFNCGEKYPLITL